MSAILSISHSLYQTLKCLPLRDAIPEIWYAAKGIVRALWACAWSYDGLDASRLRDLHCAECPLYDPDWKTCGKPGELVTAVPPHQKLGCWCYLPLANRDPKKDCWARANGLDVGWPDLLRPNLGRGRHS